MHPHGRRACPGTGRWRTIALHAPAPPRTVIYSLARRALFLLPTETAHTAALQALHAYAAWPGSSAPPPGPRQRFGLEFPNPVGLAAGLDKSADHVDALGALGFGFIEVGTVTPRPQPGNPRPRLFRLPQHRALINRMGFNNKGVDHAVERLRQRRFAGVVGVNIGKNRDTPLERALDDYDYGLARAYAVADYVTINLSSPNTPGLRSLQTGAAFDELLAGLDARRARLADAHGRRVPLLVKIAPDLTDPELGTIAAAVRRHGIDGVIATNTTADRSAVAGSRHGDEAGGLSGAPLTAPATRVLSTLTERLEGAVPVIGCGGVMSGRDAAERAAAGASLVQLYTGLIYRGPALIREAAAALAR